jgi:hypothetical protein
MSDPMPLFYAGRQSVKFRFLLYISLVCFGVAVGGFCWIAFYGADPSLDGQERWILAFVVLGVGTAFFGGMLVYSRLYVVWLSADTALQTVTIETMDLIGTRERRFGVGDFESISHDPGEMRTYYHHLKTPYFKLRVRGQGLPFVIDLQGHIQDDALFDRLLTKIART